MQIQPKKPSPDDSWHPFAISGDAQAAKDKSEQQELAPNLMKTFVPS